MIIQNTSKLAIIALCTSLLAGCASMIAPQTPTPDYSFYALDPVFRELYNRLGGKEVLGEVISEVQESRGVKKQYVVGGLLIFDSNAPEERRFQFGELAPEFGIIAAPEGTQGVAEPFQDVYKRLGGEPFIGPPLTDLIYNSQKNRYEQYFDTLGFYMGQETRGVVRLLPYGLWSCGDDCRKPAPLYGLPELPRPTMPSILPVPQKAVPQSSPTASSQPLDEATATAAVEIAASAPTTPPEVPKKQPQEWTMMVWENAPSVTSQQSQGIGVFVFLNGAPAEGVLLDLTLTMPDGALQKLDFSPTSSDGFTRLRLPPIAAANGTLITYQVCMTSPSSERYCLKESFQIWGP